MARARFGLIFAVALWLASPHGHAVIVPPLTQPSWAELSPEQKRVLAPLSVEWDRMEGFSRKKWLGIATRYTALSPEEQTRMQRRMTDWAKLTPDERKRARDQYKSLQKAPSEQKEAVKLKWKEYRNLPESEKVRLKAEAAQRPNSTSGPEAAAPKLRTTPVLTAPSGASEPAQKTEIDHAGAR